MIKNLIKLGIGLGILLYLVYIFDFRAVINAISKSNPFYLALSLLVYSFIFLILSIRWRTILSSMRITIPLSAAYQAIVGGVLLSSLTPSKLGEFARPYLAKRHMDIPSGFASVVFDKYVDISSVLFLSGWGFLLLYFKGMINDDYRYLLAWFSGLVLVFFIGSVIFWAWRKQTINIVKKTAILLRVSPISILDKLDESMGKIPNPPQLLVLCLSITSIAWFFHAVRISLLARAIGYSLPFEFLVFLLPLVAALSLIPLSISGLGFVEAGLAALLSLFGVPLYAGISIALLDRSLTFLFHVVVGSRYVKNL